MFFSTLLGCNKMTRELPQKFLNKLTNKLEKKTISSFVKSNEFDQSVLFLATQDFKSDRTHFKVTWQKQNSNFIRYVLVCMYLKT